MGVYQQALSTVTYSNRADEPADDVTRVVTFQVYDGVYFSEEVSGSINISLISDQPTMLMCGAAMATFEEGSTTPTLLTSSLVLMDLDADHVITSATVTVSNAQMGDSIAVNSTVAGSLRVVSTGGSIVVSGDGSATQYQVRFKVQVSLLQLFVQ